MVEKIAVAGAFTGTHVGGSFRRAAEAIGLEVIAFNIADAECGNSVLRSLSYRLHDRRSLGMTAFSADVVAGCAAGKPALLIVTGTAPVNAEAICRIRDMGVIAVNFSTDDPWNPVHRSKWHLEALKAYDAVFTTRCSNIGDLEALGCRNVHYLPFAYDDWLVARSETQANGPSYDVLFVGGADRDRVRFMQEYIACGPAPVLVGGYWQRYRQFARYAIGQMQPDEICSLTKAARVNICLVRRANRDGHVMRTFEAGAIGGCLAVEDTDEHREIFGEDGECVRYFSTPEDLARLVRMLLADENERTRLSVAVRTRIREGKNSYSDRLLTIISLAVPLDDRAHSTVS
jgi:spore maturation protein CgeB